MIDNVGEEERVEQWMVSEEAWSDFIVASDHMSPAEANAYKSARPNNVTRDQTGVEPRSIPPPTGRELNPLEELVERIQHDTPHVFNNVFKKYIIQSARSTRRRLFVEITKHQVEGLREGYSGASPRAIVSFTEGDTTKFPEMKDKSARLYVIGMKVHGEQKFFLTKRELYEGIQDIKEEHRRKADDAAQFFINNGGKLRVDETAMKADAKRVVDNVVKRLREGGEFD
jgi:hypothetical protein